jgi:small subunit ribosomal protein S16
VGLKGQPSYRIVAADKESPRDGRFLEILGFYNPRTEPATIHVKKAVSLDEKWRPAARSVARVSRRQVCGQVRRFQKGEKVETWSQRPWKLKPSEPLRSERVGIKFDWVRPTGFPYQKLSSIL